MLAYSYDSTGLYTGSELCQRDDLQSTIDGQDRWLIPANSTTQEPPQAITGKCAIYDGSAWSLKPEVTGTFTRPQMERIVLRSWLRDGDVFGKHIRGAVPNYKHLTKTPYAIELLEADFVPDQMNDTGKNIVQGVQLNGWRRPVAYNVLLDHPGEATGIRFTTKSIPAEDMMHLALRKRLHQVRGVSLLHGIITRLSDLKDVEEAQQRIVGIIRRLEEEGELIISKGGKDDVIV